MFHRYNTRRQAKLKAIFQEATRVPTTFEQVLAEQAISKIYQVSDQLKVAHTLSEKIELHTGLYRYLIQHNIHKTCSMRLCQVVLEIRQQIDQMIDTYKCDVRSFTHSTQAIISAGTIHESNALNIREHIQQEYDDICRSYTVLDSLITQFVQSCKQRFPHVGSNPVLPEIVPEVVPSVLPSALPAVLPSTPHIIAYEPEYTLESEYEVWP